jgi:hypothetical protein
VYWTKVKYTRAANCTSLNLMSSRVLYRTAVWRISMSNATPFVVVVDDDESVTRAIKRLSCSTGLESDTVKTGNEFLDVFESIPSYR